MTRSATPKLVDAGAERAVLGGLLKHGSQGVAEVSDLLTTSDFYYITNQQLFSVLRHMAFDKQIHEFDIPTILATAKAMGHESFAGHGRESEYLQSLTLESISLPNMSELALHVVKLAIARGGYTVLHNARNEMLKVTGDEPIAEILARMEGPVFEFATKLGQSDETVVDIHQGLDEKLEAWVSNPKDIVGLPTGFHLWDSDIGGGQRPGSVNVVGARAKNGKSMFCLNVGTTIAGAGVPVLYLDSELTRVYQLQRLLALCSGIDVNMIETGKFGTEPEAYTAVMSQKPFISNLPFTHCNIAGLPIQSILGKIRHWLMRNVGLNADGTAKPCFIIYDYLKLMTSADIKSNMAEYQLLGFLLSELHNFAVRFMVPVLATIQLNRDGVEQEGSHVFAGSDRIVWFCSSATILKRKSPMELQEDPVSEGDRKLVVTDTRFGPGMEPGNYVNVKCRLAQCKMEEGKEFAQVLAGLPMNPTSGKKKSKKEPVSDEV